MAIVSYSKATTLYVLWPFIQSCQFKSELLRETRGVLIYPKARKFILQGTSSRLKMQSRTYSTEDVGLRLLECSHFSTIFFVQSKMWTKKAVFARDFSLVCTLFYGARQKQNNKKSVRTMSCCADFWASDLIHEILIKERSIFFFFFWWNRFRVNY